MSAFEDVVEAWGFKIAGDKPTVLSPAGIAPDGSIVYSDAESFRDLIGAEPELGNPSVNGWILSSSSAGVRSWVAPNAHSHAIADVTGLQAALDAKLSTVTADATSRAANTVYAAPNGSAGSATFRAMVAADIPSLDTSKLTSGTLGYARGGTGLSAPGATAGNLRWSGSAYTIDTASYALSSAIPAASSTTPSALGTAAVGTGTTWARADHVHAMPTAAQVGAAAASHNHDAAYLGISATAAAATKLATGRTIGITGDATWTSPSFDGTANVTASLTLASVITAGGPTGNGTTVPVITYDAKGRLTAVTTAAITFPVTSVFGRTGAVVAASGDYTTAQVTESGNLYFTEARVRATPLTGYAVGTNTALAATDTVLGALQKVQGQINARLTGNQSIMLSGDASGTGSTSIAVTLASVITAGGPVGGASTVPVITYDAKGRLVAVTTATITPAAIGAQPAGSYASSSHNHTLDSLSNVTITSIATGELLRWNGTAWANATLSEAGIQPAGSYLTGNQTITLSGVVTGSGATAITTSIADAALSIAKTSGLQAALDAKQAALGYVPVNKAGDAMTDSLSTTGRFAARTELACVRALGTTRDTASRWSLLNNDEGYGASGWVDSGNNLRIAFLMGAGVWTDRYIFGNNGTMKAPAFSSSNYRPAIFGTDGSLFTEDKYGMMTRSSGGYIAVRNAARLAGEHYEFWDSVGWADIHCGTIKLNSLTASTIPVIDSNKKIASQDYATFRGTIGAAATSHTHAWSDITKPDVVSRFGDSVWAGANGYNGWQFSGGDTRFGFSSTSGKVDVYTDGDFYATDSAYKVWHAGNLTSPASLTANNTWTGVNTFSAATALNGGGTWNGSLLNRYASGWSGKFGFEGNSGISTSALFHRPSNLEALALTLYNPSNSSDSKRVFTVSCNDDSPNTAPVTVAFDVPVSLSSGSTLAGTVNGGVILSGVSLLDTASSDVTLPSGAQIGMVVIVLGTSVDRRCYAPSGELIQSKDALGNSNTGASLFFNQTNYLLVKATATLWRSVSVDN